MQDRWLDLKVETPEAPDPETFDDAAAAVDRLTELYEQAAGFLKDHFLAALANGHPGVRYRAFYPQISITTTTYAQVDSRLSFGHVAAPGAYATTITRPDMYRHYLL